MKLTNDSNGQMLCEARTLNRTLSVREAATYRSLCWSTNFRNLMFPMWLEIPLPRPSKTSWGPGTSPRARAALPVLPPSVDALDPAAPLLQQLLLVTEPVSGRRCVSICS